MTPERWQHVKDLFQSAIERAPSHRAAFLQQACAGDSELQSEVESLLAHDESDLGSLDTPPAVAGRVAHQPSRRTGGRTADWSIQVADHQSNRRATWEVAVRAASVTVPCAHACPLFPP